MRFIWDENKNRENIRKHGLGFKDACSLFDVPMVAAIDTRENYGEDRWIGIGLLKGRAVVVVFTEDRNIIRIISLRKALKHERKFYEENIQNQLETS